MSEEHTAAKERVLERIDKIIYINLDKRKDRRQEVEQEFKTLGIPATKYERFPAISEYHPKESCTRSHLAVLRLALERGYENILVLEDDFMLAVKPERFYACLDQFFTSYGDDFDAVMLAYNLSAWEEIEDEELVGYVGKSTNAAAYLLNRRIVEELADAMEDGITNPRWRQHAPWGILNDESWQPFQRSSEWFYFRERLVRQRPGYSDLEQHNVDYGV